MDRISTATLRASPIARTGAAQARLVTAQTEMTTGRLADPGRTLAARSTTHRALEAARADLSAARGANALAGNQTRAMQDALTGMGALADALVSDMATARGSSDPGRLRIAADGARGALADAVGLANTRLGETHLFGGIRTGGAPLADPARDPAARDWVSDAFAARFGHPMNDPASASIDAAAMSDFLDTLEADFPAIYAAAWGGAEPDARAVRLAPGRREEVPVTHHDPGMRDLVLAASLGAALADGPFAGEARDALVDKALGIGGRASARLTEAAGRLGTLEGRIARADEAMAAQDAVAAEALSDLVGVDGFEAAARVQSLASQIEASLAVTARLGRLSLLNFL